MRGAAKGATAQVGNQLREIQGTDINQGNFCSKCGAWQGSLGLEPHPQMYVDHMVEVCRGVRRVLKPTGSLWLNLGDSYWSKPWRKENVHHGIKSPNKGFPVSCVHKDRGPESWMQPKQLLGIPWRVAAALQNDGWILRNCIVWHKPNHMPESVSDRLTKSYEFIFFLVKKSRYYFNLDEIREPATSIPWTTKPGKHSVNNPRTTYNGKFSNMDTSKLTSPRARLVDREKVNFYNPKGKNPGDVWSIPTHPFKGAHFAVFPEALVEPIIKAASPADGVVLDPFAGSGTSLRVARRLGRSWVGVEINPEYAEMCLSRVKADDYAETPENVKPLEDFTK